MPAILRQSLFTWTCPARTVTAIFVPGLTGQQHAQLAKFLKYWHYRKREESRFTLANDPLLVPSLRIFAQSQGQQVTITDTGRQLRRTA